MWAKLSTIFTNNLLLFIQLPWKIIKMKIKHHLIKTYQITDWECGFLSILSMLIIILIATTGMYIDIFNSLRNRLPNLWDLFFLFYFIEILVPLWVNILVLLILITFYYFIFIPFFIKYHSYYLQFSKFWFLLLIICFIFLPIFYLYQFTWMKNADYQRLVKWHTYYYDYVSISKRLVILNKNKKQKDKVINDLELKKIF